MFLRSLRSLICLSLMVRSSQSLCRKDGELLPDINDCTRFFKCHQGIPTSLSCPAGLRFNSLVSTCDWPDAVNCLVRSSGISGAKLIWQREDSDTDTQEPPQNILDIRTPSPVSDQRGQGLVNNVQSLIPAIQIKQSRRNIENIDSLLARVRGRLVPNFYQDEEIISLGKPIPAKAKVVNTFNNVRSIPALKLNEGVLSSFLPKESKIV